MRLIIENWRKYLEEAPEAIDAITALRRMPYEVNNGKFQELY